MSIAGNGLTGSLLLAIAVSNESTPAEDYKIGIVPLNQVPHNSRVGSQCYDLHLAADAQQYENIYRRYK